MSLNVLKRLLAPQYLVKEVHRLGELPDGKTAYRDVMKIALPSIIEMVLMSLIGSVDTMMVGNELGAEALSSVGLPTQPRMLLLCMFFALNVGVTAIVARRKGEEKQDSGSGTTSSSTTTGAGTTGTGSTGTTSSSTTSTSSSAVSRNSADGSVLYGNHIYIDAPEKAEVYFDGIYKGIVPCSFTKESGTHVITLRRDGYETRTFTVTLDTTTQNETYSFSELQAK